MQIGKSAWEFSLEDGLAVVFDDDRFVEFHHLIVEVEGELGIVTLGDVDGVALEGEANGFATLELVFRNGEPIEVGMSDFLLSPDDLSGVGVALVLLQPGQGSGIFKVHPVGFAFDDVGLMEVAIGVGSVEGIEF